MGDLIPDFLSFQAADSRLIYTLCCFYYIFYIETGYSASLLFFPSPLLTVHSTYSPCLHLCIFLSAKLAASMTSAFYLPCNI